MAATYTVRTIRVSWGSAVYNNDIMPSDIYPTLEDAQKAAADRQRGHDEANREAALWMRDEHPADPFAEQPHGNSRDSDLP